MVYKIFFLPAVMVLATAAPSLHYDHDIAPYNDVHHNDHPSYNFRYGATDDYGNDFGHEETRDGYDTKGSYYVLLPDGRRQTVTYYVSGDSGFVAEVTYDGEPHYDHQEHSPHHVPGPHGSKPYGVGHHVPGHHGSKPYGVGHHVPGHHGSKHHGVGYPGSKHHGVGHYGSKHHGVGYQTSGHHGVGDRVPGHLDLDHRVPVHHGFGHLVPEKHRGGKNIPVYHDPKLHGIGHPNVGGHYGHKKSDPIYN